MENAVMTGIIVFVGGLGFTFAAPTEEDELTHKGSWLGLWWRQVVIACITLACMTAAKC